MRWMQAEEICSQEGGSKWLQKKGVHERELWDDGIPSRIGCNGDKVRNAKNTRRGRREEYIREWYVGWFKAEHGSGT